MSSSKVSPSDAAANHPLTAPSPTSPTGAEKDHAWFWPPVPGAGPVFVTLVRHTERQLLALGQPIQALGQQAQQLLDHANDLQDAHRQRWTSELHAAMKTQEHIRKQSERLTQGKKLSHCKIVNAYDPTIAPIIKGKSNCPAQFGRKPGIVSEPATGFIFANRVPEGNPSDPSYVLPLLDKVQSAIDRVSVPQRLRIHSVAGDLGGNDSAAAGAACARDSHGGYP